MAPLALFSKRMDNFRMSSWHLLAHLLMCVHLKWNCFAKSHMGIGIWFCWIFLLFSYEFFDAGAIYQMKAFIFHKKRSLIIFFTKLKLTIFYFRSRSHNCRWFFRWTLEQLQPAFSNARIQYPGMNMSKLVQTCPNWYKLVQIGTNFSKLAQTCKIIFNLVFFSA